MVADPSQAWLVDEDEVFEPIDIVDELYFDDIVDEPPQAIGPREPRPAAWVWRAAGER